MTTERKPTTMTPAEEAAGQAEAMKRIRTACAHLDLMLPTIATDPLVSVATGPRPPRSNDVMWHCAREGSARLIRDYLRERGYRGAFEPPDPDEVAAAEAAAAEAAKDGRTLEREALRLFIHADLLQAEAARRFGPSSGRARG